jgi:hypothetical protein
MKCFSKLNAFKKLLFSDIIYFATIDNDINWNAVRNVRERTEIFFLNTH